MRHHIFTDLADSTVSSKKCFSPGGELPKWLLLTRLLFLRPLANRSLTLPDSFWLRHSALEAFENDFSLRAAAFDQRMRPAQVGRVDAAEVGIERISLYTSLFAAISRFRRHR